MHTRAGNLAEISAQLGQQQWCRTRRAEGGWQKHAKTIQGNRSTQFDWKHSTGLARIDLQPHRLDISRHPQFASQGFSPNYSRPTSDIWHFYSYSRVLIQQPSNLAAHTHTHTPRGMCPVVSFWTSHDRPKSRGSVVHVSGFKAMEEDPTLRECPECQEPRGPRPGSCSPGVEVRGCEPTVIGDPVGDVEIRRVIGFFYCSLGDGFRGRSCEKGDRTW